MLEIEKLCVKVVNNIINNNYLELEKDGALVNMSKDDILKALVEYTEGSMTLTELPDEAFTKNKFTVVKVGNTSEYAVTIDLWMDNKWSDLSLIMEVFLDSNEMIGSYIIDDIHVM